MLYSLNELHKSVQEYFNEVTQERNLDSVEQLVEKLNDGLDGATTVKKIEESIFYLKKACLESYLRKPTYKVEKSEVPLGFLNGFNEKLIESNLRIFTKTKFKKLIVDFKLDVLKKTLEELNVGKLYAERNLSEILNKFNEAINTYSLLNESEEGLYFLLGKLKYSKLELDERKLIRDTLKSHIIERKFFLDKNLKHNENVLISFNKKQSDYGRLSIGKREFEEHVIAIVKSAEGAKRGGTNGGNKYIRFMIIDNILQKCMNNGMRREDLLDKLNNELEEEGQSPITKDTLYNDLKEMKKNYDCPIISEGAASGAVVKYRKTFSFSEVTMLPSEKHYVEQAKAILERYKYTEEFSQTYVEMYTLDHNYVARKNECLAYDFTHNNTGLSNINLLMDAISNKNPIAITYTPFGKAPKKWNFHPYFIKQYNRRWFCFGWNGDERYPDTISNIALDRLTDVADQLNVPYKECSIDWEEYFDDMLGVSKTGNKFDEIRVLISSNRAAYVKTKPWHPLVECEENEDGSIILIFKNFYINNELISEILSFGKDASAISPPELKKRVKENLLASLKNYEN